MRLKRKYRGGRRICRHSHRKLYKYDLIELIMENTSCREREIEKIKQERDSWKEKKRSEVGRFLERVPGKSSWNGAPSAH